MFFEIPLDDWYVTAPYGVSTSGLGMTSDRVSSGLVEGIYGQSLRIEQEVQSIVPFLLTKVEERLDLSEVSQVANAFWPLPVYRPRLQVYPQSVSTDDKGISLVMGVTAAAIDPRKAPATPRVERPAGVEIGSVAGGTDLRVGVAPDVLQPLTKMLIDDDVARINVLDIPESVDPRIASAERGLPGPGRCAGPARKFGLSCDWSARSRSRTVGRLRRPARIASRD